MDINHSVVLTAHGGHKMGGDEMMMWGICHDMMDVFDCGPKLSQTFSHLLLI